MNATNQNNVVELCKRGTSTPADMLQNLSREVFLQNDSAYADSEVEGIICFAAASTDIDFRKIYIVVKNSRKNVSGVAFNHGYAPKEWHHANIDEDISDQCNYLVIVRIPHPGCFPKSSLVNGKPYGGPLAPVWTNEDWQEALLAVAAHEFHHVVLFQRGNRSQTNLEARCERVAFYSLLRWRKTRPIGVDEKRP
jgi:hypothetical protein